MLSPSHPFLLPSLTPSLAPSLAPFPLSPSLPSSVPSSLPQSKQLSDLFSHTSWKDHASLPNRMEVRISIHTAPVYSVVDPITQNPRFTGGHISNAARIEPITPPGSVYCTEAFAAFSEAMGVRDYHCTYVGTVPLAKKYGGWVGGWVGG